MSQNYVGSCKQVYGCLCVWQLACVRLKECILRVEGRKCLNGEQDDETHLL